ncbi:DUF354 domain-containing protein [Candidatus Pacearchaeota archaeon]|nr:DUF354 domain-containing protein [Candidatus Pacearchaeota archaeon]
MKVLVGLGHPAHVHFYKNAIWKLTENGHEVRIVSRDKEVALKLLDAYGFEYELYGKYRKNMLGKILEFPYNDYLFYKVAREFKPDVLTGILNYTVTHVGKLINKPSIIFTDTEHANLANNIACPFADAICTPVCYNLDLGKNQVRYDGYHELAYLHPDYFKPDPSVLNDLGLTINDKFIILRLVSWEASHDTNANGFSDDFLDKLVDSIEKYGQIFITSEKKIPPKLEKYKIQIPPEKLHSALFYASLFVGEGSTTAVESALLGTPTVHVESLKLKSGKTVSVTEKLGYLDELANKYELFFTFTDQEQALSKCLDFLSDNNAKNKQIEKRDNLLKEKVDVTKFIIDIIEKHM